MSDAEIAAMLPVERAPAPSPAPSPSPAEAAALDGEAWSRVPLLPGLELHLSANASAVVKKLAAEVAATFRASGSRV
ncbi:MAG TPA: hypothetical protein VHB21_28115 [Minicystis sp.]|nr:hypothetical protein [Minicystis sp.]